MKGEAALARAAIGLRAHSGWAALVAVRGPASAPCVVERRRVEMAAGKAKQPYHTAERLPVPEASALLDRFLRAAAARAGQAIAEVLEALGKRGLEPAGAIVLTAAGRPLPALESVLASHALIHTADGEHFRDALAAAAERHGLRVIRVRERDLVARAAETLGRRSTDLQDVVASWGKPLGPPWTQDQKLSALAAWVGLERGTFRA